MTKYFDNQEFFNILNERYNFKMNSDIAYAEINGYGYSLNKTSKKTYSLSTSVDLSDSKIKRKIIRRIAWLKFKTKFEFTITDKNKIEIHIRSQFFTDKFLKQLDIILNKLNVLFIQFNIQPSCWKCNSVGLHPIYHKSNSSFMLCNECVNDIKYYQIELENDLDMNANYLTGFIGAFVGASLGGVLWVIISILGYYTYLVGYVMGYLSYNGYIRFKGKRGKYMIWILISTIVFVIILTSVVETMYYLLTYPDYIFTVYESITIAFSSLYNLSLFPVHIIWTNIGLSILFAVIGMFSYIKLTNQKNKLLDGNTLIEFKI